MLTVRSMIGAMVRGDILPAWRTVLAVAISAVLVVSLLQMPCCDAGVGESVVAAATTFSDANAVDVNVKRAAELPAQKPAHAPATHCDHCLAHVAFQAFSSAATSRLEFASVAVTLPNDTAPLSVAGLPLFKPPRA